MNSNRDQINPTASYYIEQIAKISKARKPLVVIHCITYNHEYYLGDALDGIIRQKTNFPFVAIVHEDASTDRTADILKEYVKKYPDVILPIFENENQYSKGDDSLDRIMKSACDISGGKYIAICEGDDYWTDPLKLQKQVDFLESNPEYGMCYSDFDVKEQNSGKIYKSLMANQPNKYPSSYKNVEEFIIKTGYVAPPSWLYRANLKPDRIPGATDATFVMFAWFLHNTKVHCFDESFVVYRIHNGSLTHSKQPNNYYNNQINLLKSQLALIDRFKLNSKLKDAIIKSFYKNNLPSFLLNNRIDEIKRAQQILYPLSIKERILFFIYQYFPFSLQIIAVLKRTLNFRNNKNW